VSKVPEAQRATLRKVGLRLLPFLLVCQAMAALDRINVSYAILQMKPDLGFTDRIYGLGGALFFFAYFLFEVPSNLLMERIGARKTIARIMFCWGLVSAATLWVTTPGQFYFARFLLGFFEAGFFPGVLLYLTYWYPQSHRSRITGYFFCAIALANMLGGPLSTSIMDGMDGVAGLRGWQWVFVLEGLPSTLLGIVAWWHLDDHPARAKWLSDAEKAALLAHIGAERGIATGIDHAGLAQVLRDPRIWLLCLVNFTLLSGVYTINFWLPAMIGELGVSDLKTIGMLTALPYLAALVALVWYGRRSDLAGERRRHFCVAAMCAALGLAFSTLFHDNLAVAMLLITFACAGLGAALPVFWAIPPAYLSQRGLAAGLALVTCVGQLGGVMAGALIGWLRDATGGSAVSICLISALLALGGVLVISGVPVQVLRERRVA
jgi:MFS family permease